MLPAFIIWTVCALCLIGIGGYALKSQKAVGFWAGAKEPEVTDVGQYNRAVAILWFVYGGCFELLGIPFLFLKQNSAGFVPVYLGAIVLTIALPVAYTIIEKKHRE